MMFRPFGWHSDLILALIVLAASWLLLRIERQGLDALGFNQPARRFREFISAFALMAVATTLIHLVSAWSRSVNWEWNSSFIAGDFFRFLVIPILEKAAVVVLVFQGYLLLQLLRIVGLTAGLYSAAVAFGLYDVFALDAAGNISKALPVFFGSGVYGFVLALAFRQTGSLAAPLGLNLGWHFVGKAVFNDFVPTFQMFVLPEDAWGKEAGPFGGIMSLVLLGAALGSYSWWLLRKYPGKGNADRGIKTVRIEG